jgi:hypothetical protein
MNERIEELAKNSGLWFVTDREDLVNDFAKLIIAECISEVEKFREVSREEVSTDAATRMIMTGTCNIVLNQFKQHFGVE